MSLPNVNKAQRYSDALVHLRTYVYIGTPRSAIGIDCERLGISVASSPRTRTNGWIDDWLVR